jgi:hypothetical protein
MTAMRGGTRLLSPSETRAQHLLLTTPPASWAAKRPGSKVFLYNNGPICHTRRKKKSMLNMRKFLFASWAVVVLAGAISVRAQSPEYEYVFVPTSTTDGSPLGDWSGGLFLDSSTSPPGGGSVSDINDSLSWLQTPFGVFNFDAATFLAPRGTNGPLPIPPIFWNASGITSMDIGGLVTLDEGSLGDLEYEFLMTDSSIQIEALDPLNSTAYGQWVVGVPDSASTALLISLAGAGLYGFEYFSRKGLPKNVSRSRFQGVSRAHVQ